MDDAIQLADVIGPPRHGLSRAMWAGENADLKFEAEKLALTLRPIRADAPGRPATISGTTLPGE